MWDLLKDAVDKFINSPYAQIQEQVLRVESALDDVKEPRLVILGLGDAESILIDEKTRQITGLIEFKESRGGT
jgi:hypothetical protein